MEEYCMNREGMRLFCRVEGEGAPVLLIHGSIVDADFFEETSAFLSRCFRVISYDRRGYSRSEPGTDYRLAAQTEDAEDVLRAFAGGRRAAVVGCSLGALIALRLTADHPELVSRTILHEPPLLCRDVTDAEEDRLLEEVKRLAEAGKYKSALMTFLTISGRYSYAMEKRYLPEKMDQQLQNGMVFAQHEYLTQFFERPEEYGLDRLAGRDIRCLAGANSGPAFTVRAAKVLAAETGRPLLYVPGGHSAAHDRPEEFAVMIAGLLLTEQGG